MSWKFWKKEADKPVKLARPKELPSRIGRTMVVDLKYDPDWVWSLKIVTVPNKMNNVLFDFRIFDPEKANAEGIHVKDYHSLDTHPNVIFFDGWYNKDTWEIKVNPVGVQSLV